MRSDQQKSLKCPICNSKLKIDQSIQQHKLSHLPLKKRFSQKFPSFIDIQSKPSYNLPIKKRFSLKYISVDESKKRKLENTKQSTKLSKKRKIDKPPKKILKKEIDINNPKQLNQSIFRQSYTNTDFKWYNPETGEFEKIYISNPNHIFSIKKGYITVYRPDPKTFEIPLKFLFKDKKNGSVVNAVTGKKFSLQLLFSYFQQ